MFRWIFIPLIAGIVVFSVVFFALPLVGSEADIVARGSSFILEWSNRLFDTMPGLVADSIANANLALVASMASLLTCFAVVLLMLGWNLLRGLAGWLLALFQRGPVEELREDLPPIDMHSTFVSSGDGKEVLGRGMDRLDRN